MPAPEVYRATIQLSRTRGTGSTKPLAARFHCPLRIGGELLDCLIEFPGTEPVALGRSYSVRIAFLSPGLAEELLRRTSQFEITDFFGTLGTGRIEGPED